MKRFITVLMSAMIALSMMPALAFAAEENVARIGNKEYKTLQAAVDGVQANQETEIELINSVTFQQADMITIGANKNIVLNLGTNTISVESGFVGRPIVNEGILEVKGNGTITSAASTSGYGAINNKGKLTIDGGTFAGYENAGGAAIRNTGVNAVLTINDGVFIGSGCAVFNEGSVIIEAGEFSGITCSACGDNYQYTLQNYTKESRMIINGGTVTGVQGAVSASVGYLEVNDGVFKTLKCTRNPEHKATFYALYAAGEEGEVECVINGGYFETEGSVSTALIGNDNTNGDGGINAKATAHINGGTFVAPDGVPSFVGAENTGDPQITGGNFSSDPTKYVAKGYSVAKSGDVWTVSKSPKSKFLDDIENAASGDTVTLTDNIELSQSISIDKKLTIDLAGKKITTSVPAVFNVSGNGDVVITGNGTIAGPEGEDGKALDSKAVIMVSGPAAKLTVLNGTITAGGVGSDGMYGIYIYDGGNLVLGDKNEGPTIDTWFAPIGENFTTSPANVTINNGTYTEKATPADGDWWAYFCAPIYAASSGDIVINGGIFNGYYGLSSRYEDANQKLTINGGNFNGTSQALFIDTKKGNQGEPPARVVSVKGGTFSSNPEAYVADGYVATKNGDVWNVAAYVAPTPTPEPEDPITNTGSGDNTSTNVDASDNTTTSDSGKTETTIDSTLGDKIVENAKDNNVADVVIKAETEKGDSTGSTVALPESTVQALAKDTEASVTIKTDSAEVSLDKAAVNAVAAQAGTDGEVKLEVVTVENTEDTLKVELKLVTSKGKVIDFQGGNVTVTVPVSDELASKKLVCVYIDDNGKYIKMDGSLASDGKTFTFTTGHFSTYAILSEEEANAAIDGQNISKATVSGLANKTYTGKAITQKLTVKAGDKALVEGTDYTVSYSKNVNVGVASVKITGKGKYEGTLTKTFKINPKGTSISKVTGQKKAVKVVWKKQLTKMKTSYVSGYQVQYSTSSKFTSGTSKYANAKFSKGRTTKTIKNLKPGKKYYVRVRTYKSVDGTKCYSSWSKAKSVKTK